MADSTEYLREIQQSIKQLAQTIVSEMVQRGVGVGSDQGSSSGGNLSASILAEIRDRLPFDKQFITSPNSGFFFDHSGTITKVLSSQSIPLLYANQIGYFFLQNTSTQDLWFNFGQLAITSSPSIRLLPGESFTMEGNCLFFASSGLNIIGNTIGQTFTCKAIYPGAGLE